MILIYARRTVSLSLGAATPVMVANYNVLGFYTGCQASVNKGGDSAAAAATFEDVVVFSLTRVILNRRKTWKKTMANINIDPARGLGRIVRWDIPSGLGQTPQGEIITW